MTDKSQTTSFPEMNDWLNQKAKALGGEIQKAVNLRGKGVFYTQDLCNLVEVGCKNAMLQALAEYEKCQTR